MEEFNRNKYIFSSSPAIIEVGEEVRRIREKIETDTSAPKILITKRGVGYYIATE